MFELNILSLESLGSSIILRSIFLPFFQTDSINSANSLDEGEAQVVVQSLQEELIMVRLKEAENSTQVKNLRNKIEDLEQVRLNTVQ